MKDERAVVVDKLKQIQERLDGYAKVLTAYRKSAKRAPQKP
jgi:hypothetical protein